MKMNKSMNLDMSRSQYINALDLMLQSLYKPDPELRTCAKDLGCSSDLMHIREDVIEYVQSLRNEATRYE